MDCPVHKIKMKELFSSCYCNRCEPEISTEITLNSPYLKKYDDGYVLCTICGEKRLLQMDINIYNNETTTICCNKHYSCIKIKIGDKFKLLDGKVLQWSGHALQQIVP